MAATALAAAAKRPGGLGAASSLFAPVYGRPWNDFLMADPDFRAAHGLAPPDEPVVEQWFAGGRGSFKSSYVSIAMIAALAACPRDRADWHAAVFRKVAADVEGSVFNQLGWAIDALGLGAYFTRKRNPFRIVRDDTGQCIFFHGLDKVEKKKSIKPPFGRFRLLWLEELDQFDGAKEVRTLRQSVFRGQGLAQSLYSYNPPISSANWVNAEAMKPKPGKRVYHTTYLDGPREWLGDEFVREAEGLRANNPRLYRHEYLGIPTGTGSEVFENVSLREIPDDEIRRMRVRRFGLDFGFENDPTALVCVGYDRARRTVYVFDEWVAYGRFEDGIFEAMKALGRGRWNDAGVVLEPIVADSASPSAIGNLQRMGCRRLTKTVKGAGSVAEGLRWLRKLYRIVIDPRRCPVAAREFTRYEYERTGRGELTDRYPDRDNHTIDAVRYALEADILYGAAAALVSPRV